MVFTQLYFKVINNNVYINNIVINGAFVINKTSSYFPMIGFRATVRALTGDNRHNYAPITWGTLRGNYLGVCRMCFFPLDPNPDS